MHMNAHKHARTHTHAHTRTHTYTEARSVSANTSSRGEWRDTGTACTWSDGRVRCAHVARLEACSKQLPSPEV
jgi:hypothetical protein